MAIDPLTPERRRERTRQHLIDAGSVVFGQRGYHGASLDEVAATAGFTKGAVYSNFKNKDDLFVAVLEHQIHGQIRDVEALLSENPLPDATQLDAIRRLIVPRRDPNREGAYDWMALYLEFVLYALRNPEARVLLQEFRRRTQAAVTRMVEQGWAMLGAHPKVSATAVAMISLAIFNGLDLERLVDPEAVPDTITEDVLTFLVGAERGIGVSWPEDF
ncbi:MAG TPA: TetR/AcrR family transcriptional regulator [Acidimicrobiia bacterium]|nr:TetR/AcrR family transcriptional regulator [Acidimicrobiia bacterium]